MTYNFDFKVLEDEVRLVFVNIRLARITVGLSTLANPISDFGTQRFDHRLDHRPFTGSEASSRTK